MEALENNFTLQNMTIREFVRLNFQASIKFYDNLEVGDKRKYFMHIRRADKPISPDKWFMQQEYKRYEYSFEEIASILNLTKQEVISAYVSAMKKLKLMVSDVTEAEQMN